MLAKRVLLAVSIALAVAFAGVASAQTATCYNCPPEWADFKTQLRVIKEQTGITVPPDREAGNDSTRGRRRNALTTFRPLVRGLRRSRRSASAHTSRES